MKAYRFRLLGWIFIFGIFFDMITTIIGVGIIGTRELNPIGFNWYLIITFIISMIFIWCAIKYYDKSVSLKLDMSRPKIYKIFIAILFGACVVRWTIVLNNLVVMYLTYNYNFVVFVK